MKLDDMQIYKDSIELAKCFRKLFKIMNKDDQFSIGQQMLRSSVSIASNIAEGIGRNSTNKMLLTYLGYSSGSLFEFKSQLVIIQDDYCENNDFKNLQKYVSNVEYGLGKFILYIENKL